LTINKIRFILINKNWETRIAGSLAIQAIAENSLPYQPEFKENLKEKNDDLKSFKSFDIEKVLKEEKKLLSSNIEVK
jgi:hypothetical protein